MRILASFMAVRHFSAPRFWVERVARELGIDVLFIENHPHHEAHQILRKYFLEHEEYTHLLIYAEDIIATPSHVKLLIEDWEKYRCPVVSCYCNWDFRHDWVNYSYRDLRRVRVYSAVQYEFRKVHDNLYFDEPLTKVFFVGLPLTLMERSVVEKVPLRPYTYVYDRLLGVPMRRGIMFDLQFAIDCANNNIPIYVDKRCLVVHFGDTRRYINLAGKEKKVYLLRGSGNAGC